MSESNEIICNEISLSRGFIGLTVVGRRTLVEMSCYIILGLDLIRFLFVLFSEKHNSEVIVNLVLNEELRIYCDL